MQFKFKYNEKEYILNEQNLEYFVNDEVNPIMDVNEIIVIKLIFQRHILICHVKIVKQD